MGRCLILQGGGFRAAFAAGACLALGDLGLGDFDSALAVSASAPTLAYFLTGQYAEIREVWENYVATPRLVRYSGLWGRGRKAGWPRPLLDTHHLVFEIFRDRFPLNIDQLMASRTEAYFVAMDAETFEPHYFPKDAELMYQIMWACLALPAAIPEQPILGGRRYIDGGLVDSIPVEKAAALGAERSLIVLTVPLDKKSGPPSALELWLAGGYFQDHPGLKEVVMRKAELTERRLSLLRRWRDEAAEKVVIVSPQSDLPAARITRDREKVRRTVALGYRAVRDSQEAIRGILSV